jgi:hypothetical protein
LGVQPATALSTAQRSAVWERFLVAGSAVAGATIIFGALTHFALADAADNGVSGDAIRALNILDTDGWVAFNSGLGVMMLGAGWAVVAATRLLPRWLGWIAVVVGVLLFIPFADFIALLLTLIWIIVASIMLWRSHDGSLSKGRHKRHKDCRRRECNATDGAHLDNTAARAESRPLTRRAARAGGSSRKRTLTTTHDSLNGLRLKRSAWGE